jgi:peptidoglycan hydrolase-like protein with peptidoglycan-binding domain
MRYGGVRGSPLRRHNQIMPDEIETRVGTTGSGRPLTDNAGTPLAFLDAASNPAQRWLDKATAFTAGWADVFTGDVPSLWCVALGLAVAQHETYCGDAWAGEHNWGGVQLGTLDAEERACLSVAGIDPSPQNVTVARETLATHGLTRKGGALHVDSSPSSGTERYYFAWFAAFSDDEAGATYFIRVLAANRAGCKAALVGALGAWGASSTALATAMYRTGYYEGFHDPHQPGGIAANIADYASAILALAPGIYNILASQGWTPSPGRPVFDLKTVMGYQSALTYLAGKLKIHALDPMGVDGVMGPETKAAIGEFQKENDLPISGQMNDQTTSALQFALSIIPATGVQVLADTEPPPSMPVVKS